MAAPRKTCVRCGERLSSVHNRESWPSSSFLDKTQYCFVCYHEVLDGFPRPNRWGEDDEYDPVLHDTKRYGHVPRTGPVPVPRREAL